MLAATKIVRNGYHHRFGRKAQAEALRRAQIIPSQPLNLELMGMQYFKGESVTFSLKARRGKDLTIHSAHSILEEWDKKKSLHSYKETKD